MVAKRAVRIITFLALVCVLVVGLSVGAPILTTPVPPTVQTSQLTAALAAPEDLETRLLNEGALRWFDAFVHGQIIPVETVQREARAYGPWEAVPDRGATDASDDGSLTEWADNYYIAHDWSDYGKQILEMQPGDVATVNGRKVTVQTIFNYPKDSYYEEILHLSGEGTLVFQTCYPDSEENRIVLGW